ncbi:MAG: hypothetical protein IPG66_05790 [Hydrogenophilales bacterium]|nr:hypothetical protein [Hydrogenophilales bacterium]
MSDEKILAVALGLAKPWWQSKILWVNAIAAALMALEGVTGVIQPYVPVNVYVVFAVLLPVVNALLRVIATQALTMGQDQ